MISTLNSTTLKESNFNILSRAIHAFIKEQILSRYSTTTLKRTMLKGSFSIKIPLTQIMAFCSLINLPLLHNYVGSVIL